MSSSDRAVSAVRDRPIAEDVAWSPRRAPTGRSAASPADETATATTAVEGEGAAEDGNGAAVAPRPASPFGVTLSGEDWLDVICPYLRSSNGSWRAASPVRDHRCWATDPPTELPVLTQQRLCLVRDHDDCERFLHARSMRTEALARDGIAAARVQAARFGPTVRSVPVTVATPSRGLGDDGWRDGASRTVRAIPVRLVGIVAAVSGLLFVLAMAMGGGIGRAPAEAPTTAVVAGSTATPAARVAGETQRPLPSIVSPSRPPIASSRPTVDGVARRYRVREGDTLRSVAERFGVSARRLRVLNELSARARLEPGQVLLIPAPPAPTPAAPGAAGDPRDRSRALPGPSGPPSVRSDAPSGPPGEPPS